MLDWGAAMSEFTEPTPHFRLRAQARTTTEQPVLQQWWVQPWRIRHVVANTSDRFGLYAEALLWRGEWRDVPTEVE